MDTELLLKIIGLLVTAILGILKILRDMKKPNPRHQLINDLEILDKTPDSMLEKESIAKHIRNSIRSLYGAGSTVNGSAIDWPNAVPFTMGVLFLGYLTYYFSRNGFSGWSILTGLFCLAFLSDAIKAWQGKHVEKSNE